MSGLIHGATVHPVPIFDAQKVHGKIQRDRITYYPAPPTVFAELAAEQRSRPRDISSLRVCVTGATVISPDVVRTIRDDLGFDDVFVPYGFTEATGLASSSLGGTTTSKHRDDHGRTPDALFRGRGEAPGREPCRTGETGEIFVGGHVVMAGYLQPDGIGRMLRNRSTTARSRQEIWGISTSTCRPRHLRSRQGHDRDRRVFNVFPAEVENSSFLREHPGVKDVCVVGVSDRRLGEVGCAVMVSAAPEGLEETATREWLRSRLANYKIPRHFVVVDAAAPELDRQGQQDRSAGDASPSHITHA